MPAWTLQYGFGTGICGGTSFDADADGRFRLATNYCSGPRGERTGALSTGALRRLQLAVQSASPDTWAGRYESRCVEHASSLSLTRADRGRAPTTVHLQWGCGLTGVPADARALIVAVRAVAADVFPGVHLDTMGRQQRPFSRELDKVSIVGTFDGAAVRGLDRAVAAAHETSWGPSYPFDSTDCLASVYVIRIDRSGARHAGQPTDLACNAAAAPPDARAVANAVSALLSRAIR